MTINQASFLNVQFHDLTPFISGGKSTTNKTPGNKSKTDSAEQSSGDVPRKLKRKQFSSADTASLEAIYASTNGHPESSVVAVTADSLEISETQVNLSFFFQLLCYLFLLTESLRLPVAFKQHRHLLALWSVFHNISFVVEVPPGLVFVRFQLRMPG